jgi:RNA:NAD 2'-phosphotransferase (TPT1/KptA family)
MNYPNATDQFVLITDASQKATGYILNQIGSDGQERIVACGGRSLRKAEQNYTITELELLSVVEAINKYRHYLLGKHFIIKSDHLSLKYLQSLKDSGVGRIYRWSIHLAPYSYTVEYIKGKLNPVADALSRREYEPEENAELEEILGEETVNSITNNTITNKEKEQSCHYAENSCTPPSSYPGQSDGRRASRKRNKNLIPIELKRDKEEEEETSSDTDGLEEGDEESEDDRLEEHELIDLEKWGDEIFLVGNVREGKMEWSIDNDDNPSGETTKEEIDNLIILAMAKEESEKKLATVKEESEDKKDKQKGNQKQKECMARQLSYLLRHGALREGVPMDDGGFILISNVLLWLKNASNHDYGKDEIEEVAFTDAKSRFSIRHHIEDRNLDMIRANNGHSIPVPELEVEELEPIKGKLVIHATYIKNLGNILKQGLSKEGRIHIHFSENEQDMSRLRRKDSDMAIYVDVGEAQEEGIKFYRTMNGVILSSGNDEGRIPPKYIKEIRGLGIEELTHQSSPASMGQKLKQELQQQWDMQDQTEKDQAEKLLLTLEKGHVDQNEISEETADPMDQVQIDQDYDLGTLQRACPEVGEMIRYFEKNIKPKEIRLRRRMEFEKDHFYMKDDILWHKQSTRGVTQTIDQNVHQRVVPISLRKKILEGYHNTGLCHAGFERSYMAISRSYFWHGMYTQVKEYTKTCQTCQKSKTYGLNKALLKPLEVVNGFGRKLHCDYVGPIIQTNEGFKYIFSVIDSFTTWTWLFPTKDMTAETAVKCLVQVVKEIGCFTTLVSDQAQALTGKIMQGFCNLFGIKKIRTSPYFPRSNSRVERMHHTMGNALRATCEDNQNWEKQLPFIEMGLRASPIRGLGLSPFELVHGGKKMLLPIDAQVLERRTEEPEEIGEYLLDLRRNVEIIEKVTTENIKINQEEFKRLYDAKVRPCKYHIGQMVFLHDPIKKEGECTKIRRPWRGPFSIKELVGDHNAKLINLENGKEIERLVHIDRLKRCYLQTTREEMNNEDIETGKIDMETERGTGTREETRKQNRTKGENTTRNFENQDTTGTSEEEVDGEYYSAEKILKQKKINGKTWYLIKWAEKKDENSWVKYEDTTEALRELFYKTHTKEGKLRKKLP